MRTIRNFVLFLTAIALLQLAVAQPQDKNDYRLGAGDAIRITVFQNPDLTVEGRVSENGSISYPLIGAMELGGLSIGGAEKKIADALKAGGFLLQPQVNIVLTQMRGSQASVLGQVNRPGRYPLETANIRVSDMLAMAGGATAQADDMVILTGVRDGASFRKVIDVPALFLDSRLDNDVVVNSGDTLYVQKAPVFYIYGEAQRAGSFRIERGMTVMQGLATGGGPTARGTESRLQLHRRNAAGVVEKFSPALTDLLQPNDVIYVRESLF
ncbi:MAG: polysaccharide export protein EpsE [Rhodoferax sp.]|nr:polysaccharide export protein EpsE [Rhodoferax sp.]